VGGAADDVGPAVAGEVADADVAPAGGLVPLPPAGGDERVATGVLAGHPPLAGGRAPRDVGQAVPVEVGEEHVAPAGGLVPLAPVGRAESGGGGALAGPPPLAVGGPTGHVLRPVPVEVVHRPRGADPAEDPQGVVRVRRPEEAVDPDEIDPAGGRVEIHLF